MDESRKRWVTAGILLGTVTVGLTMLMRRVPRDQWGDTLGRITTDALALLRGRYGENPSVQLVEKTLERYEEAGRETALTRAFHEALEKAHDKPA